MCELRCRCHLLEPNPYTWVVVITSDHDRGLAALQQHIADLELELAITLGELRRIRAGAAPFDRRIVAAIQDFDEAGARAALRERDEYMSEVGVLEADVHVLRVLIAECREFISNVNVNEVE